MAHSVVNVSFFVTIQEYFRCSKLPACGGSVSHTLVREEACSQDTGAGKFLNYSLCCVALCVPGIVD